MATGESPDQTLRSFSQAIGQPPPPLPRIDLQSGQVIVWPREDDARPFFMRVIPGRTERRRHRRKYAEGELPPERSFFFKGPEGKLNLRAQNLMLFLQVAEGLDDATWMHHLRRGDYSDWFRRCIKDEVLAAEAERIENLPEISPQESRTLIRQAIEEYYTVPAASALTGVMPDAAHR